MSTETHEMPYARFFTVGLELTVATFASIGGLILVSRADGAGLGLGTEDLRGFTSFMLPGLFVLGLGAFHVAASIFTLQKKSFAPAFSEAAGFALVLFSAFQMALVKPFHWAEYIPLAVGMAIYTLAGELSSAAHEEPAPASSEGRGQASSRPAHA